MNANRAYLIDEALDPNITQLAFQALALKLHFKLTGHWDAQNHIPELEALSCYALSEATSTGANDADFTKRSPGGLLD